MENFVWTVAWLFTVTGMLDLYAAAMGRTSIRSRESSAFAACLGLGLAMWAFYVLAKAT